MHRIILLLQENPPFVLAPGIELLQNVTVKAGKKNGIDSPLKCDGCGKALVAPYYVLFGIPPSSLIIQTYKISNKNDIEFVSEIQSGDDMDLQIYYDQMLKITDEKDMDLKRLVSEVQFIAKMFNIDSRYQWIFSEENIISSKTRMCTACRPEYERPTGRSIELPMLHVQWICFAVQEYQRCHNPINTAKSEYERHIISLPNRTNSHWQHFGDVDLNEDFWLVDHEDKMIECLSTALIPGYEAPDSLSNIFRTQFMQNNRIPNDQELTKWMKKCMNDDMDDDWYRIQYCKVFVNPKILKYPRHLRHSDKIIYTTKYSVVVHYSIPKGYWEEFDI